MKPKKLLAIALAVSSFMAVGQNTRYIRELQQKLDTVSTSDRWRVLSELAMEQSSIDSSLAWTYFSEAFNTDDGVASEKKFTEHITKGFLFESLNMGDSAKHYHSLAVALAEELNNMRLKAKGLESLARVNMRLGNTLESINEGKEGISLAENIGDSVSLFGLFSNIAYAYHTLTNYDSAMVFYLKGAEYCETNPIYSCAQLYNNMAITYQDQGELEKAEQYNYKSLGIRASALDSIGVADSYTNIAGTHWFRGQIDSATYYVTKAYDVYVDRGNTRGQSLCLNNLGAVYNYQGKFRKAIDTYEKCIRLHKQSVDRENLAVAYFNMAEPQLALKRYNTSFTYLDTAIETATKVGSKMILRESYNLKSKAYEEMGQIKKAWEMKELFHSYKDSIVLEANNQQVAELETRFETAAKERKINEQDLQLAQQELTIQRNGWIIAFVVGLSIFILVIAFVQRNRIKLKTNQRIAEERKRSIEQQIDAVVGSVEKERRRFSEDLHDGFGQYISLIKQKVDQLNGMKSIEEKEGVNHESEKILKEMGSELKNICFNLMPKTLIQQGVDAALTEYLFRINSGGKIATEYISHGFDESRLAEVLEINLYRICQEWTNNIMKHSNAMKINVQLIKHDDQLNLTIEDDGDGFNLEDFKNSEKGNGWKNLLSRINLVKGEVDIDTREGMKGTTLILDVPLVMQKEEVMEITEA